MRKIVLSLMLLINTLFCSDYSIDAEYDISYGFFGTIGTAVANLKVEKGTYKIKLIAKSTGLAKLISGNRIEIYESTGVIENGKLVPNIFISNKKRATKIDIKRYLFDHENKSISAISTRIHDGQKRDNKTLLPYYADEDILTLFFNLKHYLGENFLLKEDKKLFAVGANDKNGMVNLLFIDKNRRKDLAQLLEKPNHILALVLNKRIFASQKGEMYINLNNDGICISAILKDVVMFGDIRGKIRKLKITKEESK